MEKFTTCDDCGARLSNEPCTVYDREGYERRVCNQCRSSRYMECEECYEHHANGSLTVIDGGYYCETCRGTSFTRCDDCGEYVALSDATNVQGRYYCEGCYENRLERI